MKFTPWVGVAGLLVALLFVSATPADALVGLLTCPRDLERCRDRLNTCDDSLQMCSTSLDECHSGEGTCAAELASCESALATAEACGNGVADVGEDCDSGDLAGATCSDEGFDFGTLACGAGCMFDTSGCTDDRFVDTGATVIDNQTGLEWEKKTDDGLVHDKDNTYVWTEGADQDISDPDGLLFTDFLAKLNSVADCTSGDGSTVSCTGSCFAGHCDWRVPEIDELRGILTAEFPNCAAPPCIDPIFGQTGLSSYWSASTHTLIPVFAWFVNFGNGDVGNDGKGSTFHARGVRSGSP
jgi:hypothetical protein